MVGCSEASSRRCSSSCPLTSAGRCNAGFVRCRSCAVALGYCVFTTGSCRREASALPCRMSLMRGIMALLDGCPSSPTATWDFACRDMAPPLSAISATTPSRIGTQHQPSSFSALFWCKRWPSVCSSNMSRRSSDGMLLSMRRVYFLSMVARGNARSVGQSGEA